MNKVIYADTQGTYYVEYNEDGTPYKIYCNEEGTPEIYQDEQGLYYVAYDAGNVPSKVYCDAEGNRLSPVNVNEEKKRVVSVEQAPIPVNAGSYTQNSPVVSKKKSKALVWILPLLLLLLAGGGYYAYSNYFAKTKVDMSLYVIKVETSGVDGKGKATAKIENIPDITSKISDKATASEIDEFLAHPEVKYSKEEGLKNGDTVEVTLELDSEKLKEYNLETEGEFKGSFDVSGLTAEKKEEPKSNDKPNKNWFAVDGKHRADNGDHPDTQLKNGVNNWAKDKGLSLERMKGGSEFGGTILGNKVILKDKEIDLRFIRYYGETQETIKAGELLKDTYNVVGIFSDKSSVIYVATVYNGKAQVFKTKLDGGKPQVKDGLIVFEDANDKKLTDLLQEIIDKMK